MRPVGIGGKQIQTTGSRRRRNERVGHPHRSIEDSDDGRHGYRRLFAQGVRDVEFMDDVVSQQQPFRDDAADEFVCAPDADDLGIECDRCFTVNDGNLEPA